jgi:RHS repeat-associated protein
MQIRLSCGIRLVAILFSVFFFDSCFAQTQYAITPLDETGLHPFGAYDGVRENISLSTGNLNLSLPLLTFPQRGHGALALAVQYDSKYWNLNYLDNHDGTYAVFWQQDKRVPMITPNLRLAVPTLQGTLSPWHGYNLGCVHDWLFTEANGSKHHFSAVINCSYSGSNPNVPIAESDDPSLFKIDLSNVHDLIVFGKDGTQYHFKDFQGYSYLAAFDTIIDTNGNTIQSTKTTGNSGGNPITAITDTVGRIFNIDLTNHAISYLDANGVQRSITMTQTSNTTGSPVTFLHPSGTDCGASNQAAQQLFGSTYTTWTLTIPNGQGGLPYTLQFNPAGELVKIGYPDGGYTRYDFQAFPASYNFQSPPLISCTHIDFREVVAKHECRRSDGNCGSSPAPTPEDTTTYSPTISSRANQYMDVFAPDPSGTPNKTHYEFSIPTAPDYASVEFNRYIYSGSSILLRTIHTDYNNSTISDCSLPIRTTITLNDANLASKVETNYDNLTVSNRCAGTISNPTEIREYDYGLTLKRVTDATYLKTGEYALAAKHILDRSLVITVKDGSGNQAEQTTNEYDNYTAGISSSGATQHVSEDTYRGNVTAVSRWLNTTGSQVTIRKQYDDTGNTVATTDPNGNVTYFVYTDSWANSTYAPLAGQAAAYVTTITNATGQQTKRTYDSCTGSLASSRDQNDINASRTGTTYSYDALGRITLISYPDGGSTTNCYSDVGGSLCSQAFPPYQIVTSRAGSPDPNIVTTRVYDGLGRIAQTQINSAPSVIYTDTTYDSLGRVQSVSNPHFAASSATDGITSYIYDVLGRTCVVVPPDGTAVPGNTCPAPANRPANDVFTVYTGNSTTVTDQSGRSRTSVADALGRLTQITEDPGSSPHFNYVTSYSYDANNNLIGVVQNGSQQRTFNYDSLSRLLCASNPENSSALCPATATTSYTPGTTGYAYDKNGNLQTKTSPAQNQTTTATSIVSYSYDALNRLTQKSYSGGTITTPTVTFTYDASTVDGFGVTNPIGRLVKAATLGSIATAVYSAYDPVGRALMKGQCVGTNCVPWTTPAPWWLVADTYDLAGNIDTYSDSTGITFTQRFDGTGRPMQLSSSWVDSAHPANLLSVDSSSGYWPNGAWRKVAFANGLTEADIYNTRLQPCHLVLLNSTATTWPASCADSPTSVLDFKYAYNTDVPNTNNGNITGWSATGAQSFNRSFAYDSLNRLASMSQSSGANSLCNNSVFNMSWTIDAWGNRWEQKVNPGTCNAFSQPVNAKNQFTAGSYDASGNLLGDGLHSYTYDAENRIVSVDGATTYIYNALGERVRKTTGSSVTNFIYGIDGQVVAERDGTNNWVQTYGRLGGRQAVIYSGTTTAFYHLDHLGSTRLLTTYNPGSYTIADNIDYLPFGEQISGSTATTHKFTGKERDPESTLDNFGARYLGSSLGRFMSPDWSSSIVPVPYASPNDPQSLNLYSYVENNPLSHTDPTGHCTVDKETHGFWWCVGHFFDLKETAKEYNARIETERQWLVKNVAANANDARGAQSLSSSQVDGLYWKWSEALYNAQCGGLHPCDEFYTAKDFVKTASGSFVLYRGGSSFDPKPGELKFDAEGNVKAQRGVSVNTDPTKVERFGGAYEIKWLPPELQAIENNPMYNPGHFEITPREPMSLSRFIELLRSIVTEPWKGPEE